MSLSVLIRIIGIIAPDRVALKTQWDHVSTKAVMVLLNNRMLVLVSTNDNNVSLGLHRIFLLLCGTVVGVVVGDGAWRFGTSRILLRDKQGTENRRSQLQSERAYTALQN